MIVRGSTELPKALIEPVRENTEIRILLAIPFISLTFALFALLRITGACGIERLCPGLELSNSDLTIDVATRTIHSVLRSSDIRRRIEHIVDCRLQPLPSGFAWTVSAQRSHSCIKQSVITPTERRLLVILR